MKSDSKLATVLIAKLSCLLITVSEADLVDGLVEFWEFDGDYSAALDASNEGTLATTGTGSASFVTGKFGQAVDLENSANNQAVINVGDPNEFAFEGGAMSLSLWYTTESLYASWQALASQAEGLPAGESPVIVLRAPI